MLNLYRRHAPGCKYLGTEVMTKCRCAIWCDGALEGKRIRKSTGHRDLFRAQKTIDGWVDAPTTINAPVAQPKTVEEAVKDYLADCRARFLQSSTIDDYENSLGHLVRFREGSLVAGLDLEMLTNFRASRAVMPNTSIKELETLRAFCEFCRRRKWVDDNYAKMIKRPKDPDCPTMPFEDAEVTAILEACDRLRDGNPATMSRTRARARALVLVMLYTGFRISDTMKLERKRVDMKTGKVLIRVMKTGRKLYGRMGANALDALREMEDEAIASPYFFWNGESKLRSIIGVARVTISRVLRDAKVADGHPHRFRDTFAVQLLSNGEDIRTVQLLLGHSSLRTTEKHYAPFVESFQKILDTATSKLNFGGGERPPQIHLVRSA